MNLSNYPPGVTGNEDYFNPPDEECTCDQLAYPCEIHDCQGGDPDTRSYAQRAADVKKNGPIYTARKIEATPNERAHMAYLKCECEEHPGNCPRHDFPPEDIEIVGDIDDAESDPNEVIEP